MMPASFRYLKILFPFVSKGSDLTPGDFPFPGSFTHLLALVCVDDSHLESVKLPHWLSAFQKILPFLSVCWFIC